MEIQKNLRVMNPLGNEGLRIRNWDIHNNCCIPYLVLLKYVVTNTSKHKLMVKMQYISELRESAMNGEPGFIEVMILTNYICSLVN